MRLYCASGNAGKLREFRLAAGQSGVEVLALPGLSRIVACEETGLTFEENAVLKAEYYGRYAGGLLFADDSGLEVDALAGAPGVLSARYAGAEGSGADGANNRLLLENLRGVRDRRARFVCVIALADGGKILRTFRGTVEGTILEESRGVEGFGYDPLFYCEELGRSFGEIKTEEKLAVSHRGKALTALFEFVK